LDNFKKYKNARVLITGGLGFIGSNLAIKLVDLGGKVTLVDNMLPRQGGNLFNIKEIENKVDIQFADIRNSFSMNNIVKDKDIIFHLAGQVNHIDSMRNPLNDLDMNCKGTLVILEACRNFNKKAKVVFTGTRGQYGPTVKLPVDENHPMNPQGIYAVTNMAAEKMIMVYNNVHGITGVCLRISNTFGPRHQMRHDEYGVFNWFIRKAIDGETIKVFGDGRIMRDFIYVDDTVRGLLMIGISSKADGQVFNMGTGRPIDFITLAKKIVKITGSGKYEFSDFTKERKELEHGNYCSDSSKIKNLIGWQPVISLEEGIAKTVKFYREFKKYYW
jgi:UDP-glucose 4-epimerase